MGNPIYPATSSIPPSSVTNNMLPLYYVPKDRKDRKQWIRQFIDYSTGTDVLSLNRPRRQEYQRWYDLYNDLFDTKEWEYVWGTFGGMKPMTFTNYPLLNPIIQFIAGQFMQQPVAFTAYKVNANAVSERMNMESELTFLKLVKPYWDAFQQKTGMDLPFDERLNILPDNIKTFVKYDYRDAQERTVNDGLKYILTKHNVQSQFAQMLIDLVITGDEFYEIQFIDGDPVPMRSDPRVEIVDRPPTEHIYSIIGQDWHPQFRFKEVYMNVTEVLYNYEHYMTDRDKEILKNLVQSFQNYGADYLGREYNTYVKYYYADNEGLKIRVVDGQFLARNNIQFPKDFNEKTGEPKSEENSSMSKSEDIMDRFDGVKIGHEIYCKLQRSENILRQNDNYRKAHLNFGGAMTRFGLYAKCYMLQMLYNIVLSHCEFAINQAGGKAITLYLDDMPEGDDGNPEYKIREWIYQAKVQGVIIKQRKESPNPIGAPDNYQQVDFGISNTIQNLINMKIMIEQTVSRMTGVSPDQLGFTNPYQTAKATQSNIIQSNSVLAPLYYVHSKVIETALQKVCDLLKIVWNENTIRSFVLGDFGMQVIQGSNDLLLSDYGVFMQNNFDDANKKAAMLRIVEQGIATDATLVKEFIQVMNAESGVESQKIVEQGVDAIRQVQQMRDKIMQEKAQADTQLKGAQIKQKDDASKIAAMASVKGKEISAQAQVESAIINKEGNADVTAMKNVHDLNKTLLSQDEQPQQQNPDQQPKP